MPDPSRTGLEVLLVEDNPDDARFVERLLRESGSGGGSGAKAEGTRIGEIHRCDRLADALERLRTRPPDVVLLDLMLPDSDGLRTVEATVERAPTVPVVVLTGRDETELGVQAIERGADEYLRKEALTAETLRRAVRYAVERERNRRALRDRNHRLALLHRIVGQGIRNDVSMIVGRADQLRDRLDPGDEAALEALLEAARHAVDLTETAAELIDALSAPGGGREPYDLEAALDAAVTTVRRERDATITVEREDAVDGPVTVYGSPTLESVFEQLLFNAVDHSDRDAPRVWVTVRASDERASVEIADDGPGISDARKAALSDPDARLRAGSEMGVGLYFVTTVLEELGGEFDVADNDPRGTSVTVALERVGSS